jgi:polysaccharide export outer membrane protein
MVEDYRLGLDDGLDISVYGEPELSKAQRVRPDGKISLPVIGDVVAYRKTPMELRDEIITKLSRYVLQPKVTVLISEYRSKKVMIFGEVSAPGLLRLSTTISLLESISLAGGVGEMADLRGAMIIRDGRILPIDFYALLKKGDMRQNILLQANDAIFIPSNADKKVFIVGQVNRPGIYRITDELSILEVITAAGGIAESGKRKVFLIRGGLNDPQMFEVDIDKMLEEGDLTENIFLTRGDIIYVPKSLLTKFNTVLATVNNILSPLILLQSGITLWPATKSVLSTGRLPDRETKVRSITRGPNGQILTTEEGETVSKTK